MKYLVVDRDTGLVTNAVVWDGLAPYREPGCRLVPLPVEPVGVWIGWSFVDGEWVAPVEPDEPETTNE